jgi:hypothetical protein
MTGRPETRQSPGQGLLMGGRSLPTSRSASPTPTLLDLARRLTPRDYSIAVLLDEHVTLTTEQLTSVLFTSPTSARHRLHQLRRLGFLDRFTRNRPGTPQPMCWLPGPLAARYTALIRDENPPTLKVLRERQDRVYASPTLDHLLATNAFFTALLAHARTHPDTALLRWWSERTTAARHGRRINPDGHGVWTDGDQETGFYLELDRGTETIARLVDKLAAQRRLRAEGGPAYPVLFVLPSRAREQHLHRRLTDRPQPALTIATTCPEAGLDQTGPAGPVWRLAGNGRHRLSLADLPSAHGQPGPLTPGPPEPDDNPLRLLTDRP